MLSAIYLLLNAGYMGTELVTTMASYFFSEVEDSSVKNTKKPVLNHFGCFVGSRDAIMIYLVQVKTAQKSSKRVEIWVLNKT